MLIAAVAVQLQQQNAYILFQTGNADQMLVFFTWCRTPSVIKCSKDAWSRHETKNTAKGQKLPLPYVRLDSQTGPGD
jgi:hypothetical protein